jgi:hypothetical protein
MLPVCEKLRQSASFEPTQSPHVPCVMYAGTLLVHHKPVCCRYAQTYLNQPFRRQNHATRGQSLITCMSHCPSAIRQIILSPVGLTCIVPSGPSLLVAFLVAPVASGLPFPALLMYRSSPLALPTEGPPDPSPPGSTGDLHDPAG